MRAIKTFGLLIAGIAAGCAGGEQSERPDERPVVSADTEVLPAHKRDRLAEERERMAGYVERVERDGDRLILRLRDGSTVFFQDVESGERSASYFFGDYLEEIDAFLVEALYWEGHGYILVDEGTGDRTNLDAPPIISPDRRRFVTTNMDLEAGYTATRIQIYRVVEDSLELEWTYTPPGGPGWGPSDAEWLDRATVRAVKNVPDFSAGITYERTPILLRWTEDGWTVEEEDGG